MNNSSVIKHIVKWLSNYSTSSKTNGFVIGVSGGIDSALTSTLLAETNLPVLVIDMPIHQEANQVSRAKEHIDWLKHKYKNVKSLTSDLTITYDQFIKSVNTDENINDERSLVNTRARLRMTTLYYHAQNYNFLVAGTGNKVEDFGIGFFTKYGDGGVDLSPIADLYKSEVYSLSETLGVCKDILEAAPTDGLWNDNRTDEEQIGATYNELEWAMKFNENSQKCTERQKEVLKIFNHFNVLSKHKTDPIPICLIPDKFK